MRAGARTARSDPWSAVTADLQYRHLLLGLRRFLVEPQDGPRLRGVVRRTVSTARAFVDPGESFPTMVAVDIASASGLPAVVAVLREIATKPYLPRILPTAVPDEFAGLAVDATAYAGWLGSQARPTVDDCLDAVLGETVGDPTWHVSGEMLGGAAIGPPGPGPATGIVGYLRTETDRLRVYLARRDMTLGVDLLVATTDGRPKMAAPWLTDLARKERSRLDRLLAPGDSYSDHTVDFTARG